MNYPLEPLRFPGSQQPVISPVEEIIDEIRQGRMVILIDDEDRENEGDIVIAADAVTAEHINFMARYARGLICLTLTETRCRQLDLPLMVKHNRAQLSTNFTVSIEAAEGVTTGISAADRARTVQAAVAANATPTDIVRPGHIFPLMAQPGGVLARAGHTEAGCDVAAMADRTPASVICEIMNEDGSMARLPDLQNFAREHGLKIGTIADLIAYRHQTETLIERKSSRRIETVFGEFELIGYRDITTDKTHLALVHGEPAKRSSALVRVHEPVSVIELLDAGRHSHSWSVYESMQKISREGAGVIVLLRRDESENDILRQISSPDSLPAATIELKDYGIGAQILLDLGITRMRLMTRPRKIHNLTGFGLVVDDYVLPEKSEQGMDAVLAELMQAL
ncbi:MULTISPECIES: bifunctional 3,4-dihydroxy-2-butanone-4-phosphate synthase/GTP cyclohydrolase II [unclassified Methylophaga]|jgi:3,4-dihydroxy 2-butanone 4-phosphate synthase/GTP cyclohydrolase II|uniref:bifunctional 3,4-dihydroxy-2-butanone-4-phosphate synthase/GTP cyclohydrolase II n=1 Tax=unclassified Methylophaga TaxID=2629249 RepID=UPI0025D3076C|nr:MULTISPECIES: bifunctional 3,4-dihydroxy-2-butanone-4-phosphate synthase/GTP cyclohydrolase II [unclassified Methylophaga]|tara:strand:+ start:6770 stop:7954 length:1185 start_codon:yes stop_codon:yes gene_type:complete